MSAPPTPESGVAPSLPGTASPYAVKLAVFEGPLDLLLHLIRQNEVEITDIPIALICEQYLAALDLMREHDLEVAGEYLVMAATLAWIKSRMLLPPDRGEEEDEEVDPRAELVARLLEYQRYREAASSLGERPLLGREVFPAASAMPPPAPEADREIEVGLFDLVEAFRRALAAAPPSGAPHEVEVETVTVRERMLAVMDALLVRESMDFEQLLVFPEAALASRPVLVATFLAILELCRLEALYIYQTADAAGRPEGPIHVRRAVGGDGDAVRWRERIAEVM
jgi:segregation and condensation protein A